MLNKSKNNKEYLLIFRGVTFEVRMRQQVIHIAVIACLKQYNVNWLTCELFHEPM